MFYRLGSSNICTKVGFSSPLKLVTVACAPQPAKIQFVIKVVIPSCLKSWLVTARIPPRFTWRCCVRAGLRFIGHYQLFLHQRLDYQRSICRVPHLWNAEELPRMERERRIRQKALNFHLHNFGIRPLRHCLSRSTSWVQNAPYIIMAIFGQATHLCTAHKVSGRMIKLVGQRGVSTSLFWSSVIGYSRLH